MILFLYVVIVTVASQPQSFENFPFEPSKISTPVFCTLPTLILGGIAPPKISGNATWNNNPFAFL